MLEDVEVSRSLMKRMKSTGEMAEPWGTPAWIRLVAFFWDRKDVGLFPQGGKYAKSVGKLE